MIVQIFKWKYNSLYDVLFNSNDGLHYYNGFNPLSDNYKKKFFL